MFVTKKKFGWHAEHTERELDNLRHRHLVLLNKYYALLSHLGLEEVKTPAKVELRPIQPKNGLGG